MKTILRAAAASVAGSLLGAWLAVQANDYFEKRELLDQVDGMVYTFIVGKVEGNDDLLEQVLTDKAEGILEEGRHAYPGAAQEMGNRYSIHRYDSYFEEGVVIYDVKFFRPSTEKVDQYNVAVIKRPHGGWLIAKNSSVEEAMAEELKAGETPVVVHEYKGW